MNKQNTVNILVIHAANTCTWNMNWNFFLIIFLYHSIIFSLFFFRLTNSLLFSGELSKMCRSNWIIILLISYKPPWDYFYDIKCLCGKRNNSFWTSIPRSGVTCPWWVSVFFGFLFLFSVVTSRWHDWIRFSFGLLFIPGLLWSVTQLDHVSVYLRS